ncbi:MAG TPA: hypothetical protein VN982_07640 [Candidatus Dormibacteraeota bacterium]|nr:hypothetical protein [Candidatus Dormibacteraeota bacterium]
MKDRSGAIHAEGTILATHFDLDRWMKTVPQPWTAAMEATVFSPGLLAPANPSKVPHS